MEAVLTRIDSEVLVRSLGVAWVNELFAEPAVERITLAVDPLIAEIEKQTREYLAIERQTRIAMIQSLENTRRDVVNLLRSIPEDRWRIVSLRSVLNEIDDMVAGLQTSWANTMTMNAENIFALTTTHVEDMIKLQFLPEYSASVFLPGIPIAIVEATADYYAAFITGVSNQVKANITRIVSSNISMGAPLFDTVQMIGRNLKDPSIFRTIRNRAETIARTESTRVRGQARQLNRNRMETLVPGLKKGWSASFINTRESHAAADSQYGEGNEIPIGEPFIVGNSALMFEGDPAGSAEEIINCACYTYEVVPDDDPRKRPALKA